jgi:predicted GNAT family N-acyltransferase
MSNCLYFLCQTSAEIAQALALRHIVFTTEQGVSESLERDAFDQDPNTLHFLGLLGGTEVVAVARAIDKRNGVAKIGRVAVAAEHRGRRIGGELMGFVLLTLEARGFREATLHAQLPVVNFYERLGFIADGDVFTEANISHRAMHLTL